VANALSTAPIISIADPNARKGLGEQLSETVETLAILNIQYPMMRMREAFRFEQSLADVRFAPESGQIADIPGCPLCADIVVKVQNCPVIIFPP
jgi:hypothetical protein